MISSVSLGLYQDLIQAQCILIDPPVDALVAGAAEVLSRVFPRMHHTLDVAHQCCPVLVEEQNQKRALRIRRGIRAGLLVARRLLLRWL